MELKHGFSPICHEPVPAEKISISKPFSFTNFFAHPSAIGERQISKIEVEHENMFKMLKERLENDAEFVSENEEEAWICEVCGHIHYGKKL